MEDVKAQALAQTSYKDEWSILHSSKAKEYTDFILKKLEPLGVKRYTKCYVFTEIKCHLKEAYSQERLLHRFL